MSKPWPYRALLRMLPPSFRARHRAAIDEALAAAWNESGAVSPAWRFWLRASLDLSTGLLPAWISTMQRRFPTRRSDRHDDEATSMDGWLQDIRYAARGLIRAPALTLLCTAAIGLGMGANTAVFTLVNEILLRPLPVREPAQLVDVHLDQPGANSFLGFSFLEYEDYRSRRKSLEGLVAHSGIGLRLGDQVGGDRIRGQLNSADYFEVLGVTPARGRTFTAREAETEGRGNVAVVSHGFWQRRFAGSDDLLGSDIELNGIDFTVVGILPAGFTGRFIGFPSEVWLPLAMMDRLRPGTELRSRAEQGLEIFGRLRAEDSIAAAADELNAIAAQPEREHPDMNRNRRVTLSVFSGLDQSLVSPVMGFLGILLVLSTLVLLAACLNVGNLLLARGPARRAEIATRVALGATPARMVRQILTETLLLFALGAGAAVLVALQVNGLLGAFIESLPVGLGFSLTLDARVLAITGAVALITALATGLGPALKAIRGGQAAVLRTSRSGDSNTTRLRQLFVVGQVAVSVVLLITASLFLRAFQRGQQLDPGFSTNGLSMASVGLPPESYSDGEARVFFQALAAGLATEPDIAAVGLTANTPLGVARSPMAMTVPGQEPPQGQDAFFIDVHVVSADYFDAVGIVVQEGSALRAVDDATGAPVAVVNARMAARFWPRGAVGQRLMIDGGEIEIIGVVGDTRYVIQSDTVDPLVYLPFAQHPGGRMSLVLRSDTAPGTLQRLVAEHLARADATLQVPTVGRLSELIEIFLLPQRLASRVAGALGALGFLLAVAGVYGIVSYTLGQRRRELGIRMALGGRPADVRSLMLKFGLRIVGAGSAAGLVVSALLGPLLRDFLVGVAPTDPLTMLTVVASLGASALLAAYVPARRAAAIDPATALRYDV